MQLADKPAAIVGMDLPDRHEIIMAFSEAHLAEGTLYDWQRAGVHGEFMKSRCNRRVHGELIKSCGDWSLVQPSTMPPPPVRTKIYW
jgi:hypothetical protein